MGKEWAKWGLKRIQWPSNWQQKVETAVFCPSLSPTQLHCNYKLRRLLLSLPPSTVVPPGRWRSTASAEWAKAQMKGSEKERGVASASND